ncbi:MAG: tetratricopeptide repeat protein [Opitutales bacterium]
MIRQRSRLTCLLLGTLFAAALPLRADAGLEAYYTANALFNKKLFDLAEQEYETFLKQFPRHDKTLNAKLGLALARYEQKQFLEAEPVLAELAGNTDAPHQVQVHNLWGQCLLVAGRPADAEKAFRWSVNRGRERLFIELPGVASRVTESPEISVSTVQDLEPLERSYAGMIEAQFQQQKWNDVVLSVDELSKLVPNGSYTARVTFLSALAKYELGQFAASRDTLLKLAEKYANSSIFEHTVFLLGECERELGNLDNAAVHHELVARKINGHFAGEALFRLGFIRFLQENYESAAKAFRELRTRFPESPFEGDAGIYLGRAKLEQAKFDEARAQFIALQKHPKSAAEAFLWLGKTFLREERFEEAKKTLEPALTQFAKHELLPDLHFDYANALLGLEEFGAAALFFEKASDGFVAKDRAADALRLNAFALNRDKTYERSLASAETFVELYPNDPYIQDVAFLRAENLYFLNRRDEAAVAYQHFIPFQGSGPYTNEAHFRIAQYQVQQKKWTLAYSHLEPLLTTTPQGPFFDQLNYLAGLSAFELESWQESAERFAAFVSQFPDKGNVDVALLKLSQARERSREPALARQALEQLLEKHPTSPLLAHAQSELGRLRNEAGEYAGAREVLQAVLTNPNGESFVPQATYYLGWVSLAEGNKDEAKERFSAVAETFIKHPLAPDALFQKAFLHLETSELDKAEQAWRAYLDTYPQGAKVEDATFYLAATLSRREHFDTAIAAVEDFLNKYPSSHYVPQALYEWAWSARKKGDVETARRQYQALAEATLDESLRNRAHFELAELEYSENNYQKSLELTHRLLSRELPDKLLEKVLYRQAWCLLGQGNTEPAAQAFERVLANFPKTSYKMVSAYQAGEIRLAQHAYEAAYTLFKSAATAPGETALRQQAILRVGECETLTNRWKLAQTTFTTFLKEHGESGFARRARMWLGWSLENQKAFEEAAGQYRQVIASGEKDELAARSQFQLGECLFALGQYDEAIKELVKVDVNYNFPQWSSRAILEVGQVLVRQGRQPQAQDRFEEVVVRFPGTREANAAEEILKEGQRNR